jgi:DNA-binding NtrC family response regulator
MTTRVLIIDDDAALNQMLQLDFEDLGYEVCGAEDCASAERLLDATPFDLVLLDQQLPDGTGAALLPRLLVAWPRSSVIMMTGQHDLELAIEAIKLGADDFVHKPINAPALQATVRQLLARRRARAAALEDAVDAAAPGAVRDLIGRSNAMLEVSKDIALSAENAATVLISGESGTGKEVVARLIHQHSSRRGPFVAINCAAIVDSLLESELFGHEKGAFTGAATSKPGKFELANEGTLFLDEIGELAPQLQAKLLRVLQERQFERVGGTASLTTTARVIAATHRDLFAEARRGQFREDLAYRLSVINIHLPALRERREDIPLLAEGLLKKAAEQIGKPVWSITAAALAKLSTYDWPGNVRELENVLTQALVHARDAAITPDLIRFGPVSAAPEASTAVVVHEEPRHAADTLLRTLDQVEAEHVQRVLDHTQGHKGQACEILGISRPALDRKIKKFGLRLPD